MPPPRSLCVALVFAFTTAGARAQAPTLDLPKLLQLGPTPATAAVFTVRADGSMHREGHGPLAAADAANALPRGADAPALVLRIDARARTSVVGALLSAAQATGVAAVHFAAALPDGTAGCFTLALPHTADVGTSLDLRLHHERNGVPPASVVPLLQRIVRGLPPTEAAAFTLGIEVPGDAPWERTLQALGAIAGANVPRVALACGPSTRAPAPAAATAFAMDLGPVLAVQVPPLALPQPRPKLRAEAVGFLERAPEATATETRTGAGGRFGARFGGRGGGAAAPVADAIAAGKSWFARWQRPDGSFAEHGAAPDPEATALLVLGLLGDGGTLDGDRNAESLRTSCGWLLAQQRHDGHFADGGPGSVRQHALATYALAEAAGLSSSGVLLRGSVQDGLHWLFVQRQPDGGFCDGTPGQASDAVSTALCVAAVASAKFFGFAVLADPAELVAWFDTVAEPTGAHRLRGAMPKDDPSQATATAAALFSRFFAGQDPKQVPIMKAAADLLLATADPADPWCCYWTTYALFQFGGRHWAEWNKRLSAAVVKTQVQGGDLHGLWKPTRSCSRLTTTALNVLTLEAYYRYSRLVR